MKKVFPWGEYVLKVFPVSKLRLEMSEERVFCFRSDVFTLKNVAVCFEAP